MEREPNRLIDEKSPYLIQHAYNPVDWRPWDEEAFLEAEAEEKLIFLSIGYSTCHWCHVMERESFQDEEVAALLNKNFVAIKVDREERPDIDAAFMQVCQMMTGSGGWPLTIILTPDRRPFFAATYLPKHSRFGRVGLMDLLPRLELVWKNRRDEVFASANQVINSLKKQVGASPGKRLDEKTLAAAFEQLSRRFDPAYGGFGNAPKFPTPHNLMFLLRYYRRTGEPKALKMVEETLTAMSLGGIHDQLGFGFHRYSTDRAWLLPHFEKMLYDQALLAMAYLEAYQVSGRDDFAETARRIFTYVLRDMRAPEGGFFSAEDADSEGEEGRYYLWRLSEVKAVLEPELAELAIKLFNLTSEGNFYDETTQEKTGANILYLARPLERLAGELDLHPDALAVRLESIRDKLLSARNERVRPRRDDKVLADWNGLMIAALAKGARALGEPVYAEAAAQAAEFILAELTTTHGRLLHRYRDRDAAIDAFAGDYAFFVWGLLELHQATQQPALLRRAVKLTEDLIERFWADDGGLYQTAEEAEALPVRLKEIYDGATPSANSVAAMNLIRLARLTGRVEWEVKAERLIRAFAGTVKQNPSAYTHLLMAVELGLNPGREVVVVGDAEAEDVQAMLAALAGRFDPETAVVLKPDGPAGEEVALVAEYTAEMTAREGRATAYVCTGQACAEPTTDVNRLLELLED